MELYSVYTVEYKGKVVYIGSGISQSYKKLPRWVHVFSGCSHSSGLNQLYFCGDDSLIVRLFLETEDREFAYAEELRLISKYSPALNVTGVTSRNIFTKDYTSNFSDLEHFTDLCETSENIFLSEGLDFHSKKHKVFYKTELRKFSRLNFQELCNIFLVAHRSLRIDEIKHCCTRNKILNDFNNLIESKRLSLKEVEGIFKRNRYVKKNLSLFLNNNFGGKSPEKGLYSIGIEDLALYFNIGERYSLKDIKLKLKNLYIKVGESKTPVATDLKNWYEIRSVSNKHIGNGFEILGEKVE